MVVKTEICPFTEYRIYPGHGQRFIARDGKVHYFISQKVERLAGGMVRGRRGAWHQKVKPVKLRWTQAWRRMNKKGKVDEGGRKRTRKAQKFQKAIVGMSLEDIKKKAQKPELRQVAKEAAAKEAKARQSKSGGKAPVKAAGASKTAGGAKPKGGAKASKADAGKAPAMKGADKKGKR